MEAAAKFYLIVINGILVTFLFLYVKSCRYTHTVLQQIAVPFPLNNLNPLTVLQGLCVFWLGRFQRRIFSLTIKAN